MNSVRWGIIGCGDVTELKSGPAFNKVADSQLVAVMRRDAAKAEDYARRHGVAKWYSDADALINDPDVNAIYIATPPSSHKEYTLAALQAGKPVYVEKPMTLDHAEAMELKAAALFTGVKLVVAHYRRGQELFKNIRALLQEKVIGQVQLVNLRYCQVAPTAGQLAIEKYAWRINPAVSGGGLFHDIAPHQLDILRWFFGETISIKSLTKQSPGSRVDDLVTALIEFENGVVMNGSWCFNVPPGCTADEVEIIGDKGRFSFSVFGAPSLKLRTQDDEKLFRFSLPEHVQQPMIAATVQYFLDKGPNPCTATDGVEVMRMMDEIVGL